MDVSLVLLWAPPHETPVSASPSSPPSGAFSAWSLVMSLFGDAIVPRGGVIGLSTIVEVMGALGVDAGAVRTAMSRLTRDGWVERTKRGRNAFYRLTPRALAETEAASALIYAAAPPRSAGWRVLALAPETPRGARAALLARGAGALGPDVLVLPDHRADPAPSGAVELASRALTPDGQRRLAERAFDLAALDRAYAAFAEALAGDLEAWGAAPPRGLDALARRVLLIHRFRRLVLRDPGLPLDALPEGWPGLEARRRAAEAWLTLRGEAERWLDANGETEAGPLPPPDDGARRRFR
jgi:phenylacetic acid degradation operon negative regulatory protein